MNKSDNLFNLAGKRGFFFPSAEIYGSKAGFWTYGHLGTLMKRKWENLWRNFFLKLGENYFEIEDCNILPREVFQSSGHLQHFNDPIVESVKSKEKFRADELIEEKTGIKAEEFDAGQLDALIKKHNIKAPNGENLGKVQMFNMMFDLKVGAFGKDIMMLRPETAQSAYLSFKREFNALREKLPFGLAVVGKAFRNEISPRQGFYRLREFTQAELQIFFNENEMDKCKDWDLVKKYKIKINDKKILASKLKLPKFYVYHMVQIQKFYLDLLKIPKDKFRFRELNEKEKAFYNKIHYDIELKLDSLKGWKEVAGLHYRTDYDLTNHQKGSKEKLEVNIDGKKIIPHVLELSFGVDRNVWGLIDIFYKEEKERTLFNFNKNVAPVEVAVFPLVNKDKLPDKAMEVYDLLKDDFGVFYDCKGSIGRMYRRMDEVGCLAMITIDHETLKNKTVTLRDRDSMKQIRVKINKLKDVLDKFLDGEKLSKLGKVI
ncbi:glycine--tRNA ligase [archaeon]|nr:glycine--tRNA ligase [archaeon]